MKLTFRKAGGDGGDLLVSVATEPEALVVTTRTDGSRTKRALRTPVSRLPGGDVELAAANRRAELLGEGYVEESRELIDPQHCYYLVVHPEAVVEAIDLIREKRTALLDLGNLEVVNVQDGVLVQLKDGSEKLRITTGGARTGLLGKSSSVTVVGLWLVALGHADASKEAEADPESLTALQARKVLQGLAAVNPKTQAALKQLGMDGSGLAGNWAGDRSYEAVLL